MPTVVTRREKMLGHVARWKSGALSKSAYCQRSGIDYNQFQYWCRVSKDLVGRRVDPKPVFLPIQVEAVASHSIAPQEITVTGPSGLVARFPVCDEAIAMIRQLLNG